MVLTERAPRSLYRVHTYQPGPQTNPELRSARLTEWCWTNFFHVSSELARPISLGACTQHRAARVQALRCCDGGARVPAVWGGPKRRQRSTPPACQPTPVWGTGGVTALACPVWPVCTSCYPPAKSHRPVKARQKSPPASCSRGLPRVAVSVPVLTWYAEIWSRHGPREAQHARFSKVHNAPLMLTRYPCIR